MLAWLIIAAFGLPLLLMLALLVIPFYFKLELGKNDRLYYSGSLNWLWGRITFVLRNNSGSLTIGRLTLKTVSFNNRPRDSKTTEAKKENVKRKNILPAVKTAGQYINRELIALCLKAIKRSLSALSLKIKGESTFGFEDPSLTGLILGFISFAGINKQPKLILTPDFERPVFEGNLSLRGKIPMGKLLLIIIKFMLARPVRRIWLAALRRKKEVKKNVSVQHC